MPKGDTYRINVVLESIEKKLSYDQNVYKKSEEMVIAFK
jgi:hypothetical protein